MSTFLEDLETLINRHSMEAESDTPDYILAKLLSKNLTAFGEAVKRRDKHQQQQVAAEATGEPAPRSLYVLASKGPVVLLMSNVYQADAEHAEFFYNEHSCPINWLHNVVEVYDPGTGRRDPHGVFEFVGQVPDRDTDEEPYDFAELANLLENAEISTEDHEAERKRLVQWLVSRGKFGRLPDWYLKAMVCGRYGYSLRQLHDEPALFRMAVASLSAENEAVEHQQRMAADRQQGRG